jgi:hypothetical protein
MKSAVFFIVLVKLGRFGGIFEMPLRVSEGIKREWYLYKKNKNINNARNDFETALKAFNNII